jgi:hypothetical protein
MPAGVYPRPSAEVRFWRRVDKNTTKLKSNLRTRCWEWIGGTTKKGYGNMGRVGGRWMYAHQFSYELHYGPVADGKQVNHKCDNRSCVRPAHLYEGSQSQNMKDRARAGRMVGETHTNSKLSEAKVRAIRADKRLQTVIAKAHGVSRATICLVRQRKVWAHVA